jgi:hypothetical protein
MLSIKASTPTMKNRPCSPLKHQDSCNSINASDLQALELLDKIMRAMDSQIQKYQELDNSIVEQMLLSKSAAGAADRQFRNQLSCMRKLGHLRQEREKVSSAIDVLESHADQLESALYKARRKAVMEADWGSTSTVLDMDSSSLPSMGSISGIDLTPHESFAQEIEEILSSSSSSF